MIQKKKMFKNIIDKIITTTVTPHFWCKYPKIISHTNFTSSPSKYLYLGFVWSNDPESYAGDSNATGRTCHARQVANDDPDKKASLVLQDGG
jgi:hypothetical protein